MRLLSASDLHFNRQLFEGLGRAVAAHSPDVIAIPGDIAAFFEPPKGVLSPRDAARLLAEIAGDRPVICCRGNHDREEPWAEFWGHRRKNWTLLEGTGCDVDGVGFVGFPSEMNADEAEVFDLLDWNSWLPKLPVSQLRGIWLLHEPPTTAIADWRCVAARWQEPILQYSPVLSLSGHDHELDSPWITYLGDTVAVCAGQGNTRLRYVLADLDVHSGDAPSIRSIERFVA